jgi:hypothetical protein
MSDYDIHSCGYYCDRPACIKRQRDELRDKLFEGQAVKTYSGGKPNYTQPIEQEPTIDGWPLYSGLPSPKKEWVGLTAQDLNEVGAKNIIGAIWADAKLKEKNGF